MSHDKNDRKSQPATDIPPDLATRMLRLGVAGPRRGVDDLIDRLRTGLAPVCARHGWRLLPSDTAIQPLVIGGNRETLTVAEDLLAQGVWAPAIRPPTVPAGQARLRISLSAAHSEAQVDRLVAALAKVSA